MHKPSSPIRPRNQHIWLARQTNQWMSEHLKRYESKQCLMVSTAFTWSNGEADVRATLKSIAANMNDTYVKEKLAIQDRGKQ